MRELGIELPAKALTPRANAVAWKRFGDLVVVSGQGPAWDGAIVRTGRVGDDCTMEEGQEAARLCALNVLFHVKDACGGNLDRVQACLSLTAFVRCTPEYDRQPMVVNGASDLIVEIFGEVGAHTRTAVGVSSLPLNMPVELSAIWAISGD